MYKVAIQKKRWKFDCCFFFSDFDDTRRSNNNNVFKWACVCVSDFRYRIKFIFLKANSLLQCCVGLVWGMVGLVFFFAETEIFFSFKTWSRQNLLFFFYFYIVRHIHFENTEGANIYIYRKDAHKSSMISKQEVVVVVVTFQKINLKKALTSKKI